MKRLLGFHEVMFIIIRGRAYLSRWRCVLVETGQTLVELFAVVEKRLEVMARHQNAFLNVHLLLQPFPHALADACNSRTK